MTTSGSAADQAGSASTSASPARSTIRLRFLSLSFCFFLAMVGNQISKNRRTEIQNTNTKHSSLMDQRSIIQQTADHVRALLSGEGTGHDWHHIERVRRSALAIAREEGADLFVVEQAALLHDIA